MQGDGAERIETNPAARSPEAGDATASAKAFEAKGKYHSISGFIDGLEYVECNTGNIDPEQALQEQREIERFLAEKDAVKAKTGSTFDCICRDQLWLGAFWERVCWWEVVLLVISAFAGGKSFCWSVDGPLLVKSVLLVKRVLLAKRVLPGQTQTAGRTRIADRTRIAGPNADCRPNANCRPNAICWWNAICWY